MKITIEWANGSQHVVESEMPNFCINNHDREMMKYVRVEMMQHQDTRVAQLKSELEDMNSGWLNACKNVSKANQEIENLKFYMDGLLEENKYLRSKLSQYGKSGQSIPCKYTEGM